MKPRELEYNGASLHILSNHPIIPKTDLMKIYKAKEGVLTGLTMWLCVNLIRNGNPFKFVIDKNEGEYILTLFCYEDNRNNPRIDYKLEERSDRQKGKKLFLLGYNGHLTPDNMDLVFRLNQCFRHMVRPEAREKDEDWGSPDNWLTFDLQYSDPIEPDPFDVGDGLPQI